MPIFQGPLACVAAVSPAGLLSDGGQRGWTGGRGIWTFTRRDLIGGLANLSHYVFASANGDLVKRNLRMTGGDVQLSLNLPHAAFPSASFCDSSHPVPGSARRTIHNHRPGYRAGGLPTMAVVDRDGLGPQILKPCEPSLHGFKLLGRIKVLLLLHHLFPPAPCEGEKATACSNQTRQSSADDRTRDRSG